MPHLERNKPQQDVRNAMESGIHIANPADWISPRIVYGLSKASSSNSAVLSPTEARDIAGAVVYAMEHKGTIYEDVPEFSEYVPAGEQPSYRLQQRLEWVKQGEVRIPYTHRVTETTFNEEYDRQTIGHKTSRSSAEDALVRAVRDQFTHGENRSRVSLTKRELLEQYARRVVQAVYTARRGNDTAFLDQMHQLGEAVQPRIQQANLERSRGQATEDLEFAGTYLRRTSPTSSDE